MFFGVEAQGIVASQSAYLDTPEGILNIFDIKNRRYIEVKKEGIFVNINIVDNFVYFSVKHNGLLINYKLDLNKVSFWIYYTKDK